MTAHRLIRTAGAFACVAGAAAIGLLGCDKSPTKPSSDATTPVLTNLSVTGTVTATTIGQTIQLTATAAFSDKATRNVTSEAQWTSLNPSVATVSPAGLVTILNFGVCNISAKFQSLTTTRQINAIRPALGELAWELSGVAVGDDGRPIANAQVSVSFGHPAVIAMTDEMGRYNVRFEAKWATVGLDAGSDYEDETRVFRPTGSDPHQTLDFHPRLIRWIQAGEPVSVTVAPGDAPCFNNVQDGVWPILYICRTFRMIVPADGVLTAEARSIDPSESRPPLEMEGPGILDCCYLGNPLTMSVTGGMVIKIRVEILESSSSQTFTLTTRIR